MDVVGAIDRLRRAHADAGLGVVGSARPEVAGLLARIEAAVAPLRLPQDLVTFWRSVDPDTLAVAPCPRPASAELCLRMWREHLSASRLRSPSPLFPWAYESHDFGLVELASGGPVDGPSGSPGGGCFRWSGPGSPVVRVFSSVASYLDLLATMIELGEFVFHPQIGVIEFDPERRWSDAQIVRLAAERPALSEVPTITTIAALQERSSRGEPASGVIRAHVVSLAGSAAGNRIEVTDGTALLDVWCPASICWSGPIIERWFEFEVTLQRGCASVGDVSTALGGVERATRSGDLQAAVALATPLYDRIFGTPAAAQAATIRPLP